MVRGHQEHVVQRRKPVQHGAEQWTFFERKRFRHSGNAAFVERLGLRFRVQVCQIVLGERERRCLADHQLRAVGRDRCAQRVVASDQAVERGNKCARVEDAAQAQLDGLVVRQGGLLTQLVAKPHFALRLRGRDDLLDRAARKGIELDGRGGLWDSHVRCFHHCAIHA